MASLTGVAALLASSIVGTIAMCVAFLALPGLILSIVALSRHQYRLAYWGVALGLYGTLNLPIVYMILMSS